MQIRRIRPEKKDVGLGKQGYLTIDGQLECKIGVAMQ